ncbi:MAG: hypothetical protein RIF41_34125 [Polyangiaceae bacterium]
MSFQQDLAATRAELIGDGPGPDEREFAGQVFESDFGAAPRQGDPEPDDRPALPVLSGGREPGGFRACPVFEGEGTGPTIDAARRDAERQAHDAAQRFTFRGDLVWQHVESWSRHDAAGVRGIAVVLVPDTTRVLTAEEQRALSRERGERRTRAEVLRDLRDRLNANPADLIAEALVHLMEDR